MKVGLQLHQERGIDAVLEEAKSADRQGFSTVWLFDHLASPFGADTPEGPFDSLTLMVAIAMVTDRTRLAWAMLNLSFRRPAVLAKMLATLDHISKGRVLCSVGSGWFKKEYEAYDIPLVDDHDERVAYGHEVVQFLKEVWTHPAPETVDFAGRFVHVQGLAFSPAPYTRPHPPIWIGGESDATLASVKELADGWVMLTSGTKDRLAELTSAADWPARPMDLVRNVQIHVAATREEALDEAAASFGGGNRNYADVDEYVAKEVVGSPDECVARLREIGSWGITEVRVACADANHQERIATMILPRL
jgi:alkanesulfonate monooxygenase SsuD/methylene tetrahydromethanopterin reductase-like flavin-dependent oxidoreductase (luciferase family)